MKEQGHEALVTAAVTFGIIGLIFGIGRGIHSRHASIWQWLGGLSASVVVAVLLGWSFQAAGFPTAWAWPVIGACAFIAEDVLGGLRTIGGMIRPGTN